MSAYPLERLCASQCFPHVGAYDVLTASWEGIDTFVSVSQVVALTQILLWAEIQNCTTSLGNVPVGVATYVSRMNAYRLLGIAHEEHFVRHAARERFLPMGRIVDNVDAWRIADAMSDVITSHLDVDQTAREMLDLAFGEIMDNIIQHADSPLGGIAAAQYYARSHTLEICVSDCGRGIAASMATNPDYGNLNSAGLVLEALKAGRGEGVATGFGGKGAGGGMGLAITARLVSALRGTLWITTANEHVVANASGTHARRGLHFPGTILTLKLPVVAGRRISASDIVASPLASYAPHDSDTNTTHPTDTEHNILW